MTKVAIALFGTRVSPRFDCAPSFRIIEVDNSQAVSTQDIDAQNLTAVDRVNQLQQMNVNTLICGGIDMFSAQQLNSHNIELYSWITGLAQDALDCLLRGQLQPGFMMAPGGRCCGQWRCGQGRGQGPGPGRGRGPGRRQNRPNPTD